MEFTSTTFDRTFDDVHFYWNLPKFPNQKGICLPQMGTDFISGGISPKRRGSPVFRLKRGSLGS